MSLARAFTTRRKFAEKPSMGFLGRAASQRVPGQTKTKRPMISGPITLISSTNVLSFEAPDIDGTSPTPMAEVSTTSNRSTSGSSAASTSDSGEYSDASSTSVRSRDTSTDASSVGDSTPTSPEPNHLSTYFKPSTFPDAPNHVQSTGSDHSYSQAFDAPNIPERAPSHSKKAHVQLSRRRSIQRMATPPSTVQEIARDSSDLFRGDFAHPFEKELEQLEEAVEEFGSVVRDAEADADRVFMEAHGLSRVGAADYIFLIQDMLRSVFEEDCVPSPQAGWI